MNEILRRRWARWLLFFVLLLPSAQFAWRNRDMPKFGLLLDDGTVYSAAKSLVAGDGYRIPNLPGKPFETKYPPLYPWYLTAVWKLDPQFPANLRLATLLNWLLLIPYLGLAWVFFRRCGFSENRALLIAGLLGVNPYLILMGTSVSIEVFFTCWLFVVFLVAERKSSGMAFVAGLAAGCAYLSRTAGIALLVSIPLWYLWDRSWRRAAAFLAGMMPFVAGWILWTASHRLQTSDPALLYHTDYTAFFFQNMDIHNVFLVAWRNLGELLLGMGSLVVPKVSVFRIEKLLAPPIALGMVAGLVRLARRGIARPYALFALISAAVLVVWNYPPNERLLLPLYPLLLAGLITEVEHLARMIQPGLRYLDRTQQIAARALATALALVAGIALLLQFYGTFWFLPDLTVRDRARLIDRRAAYAWMVQNLPPSARVLSLEDPLLYLYTGLSGSVLALPTRDWYNGDHAAVIEAYRNVAAYCRSRGLQYFYSTADDLARGTGDADIQQVLQVVRENPELTPIFTAGFGTIYRVRPSDH